MVEVEKLAEIKSNKKINQLEDCMLIGGWKMSLLNGGGNHLDVESQVFQFKCNKCFEKVETKEEFMEYMEGKTSRKGFMKYREQNTSRKEEFMLLRFEFSENMNDWISWTIQNLKKGSLYSFVFLICFYGISSKIVKCFQGITRAYIQEFNLFTQIDGNGYGGYLVFRVGVNLKIELYSYSRAGWSGLTKEKLVKRILRSVLIVFKMEQHEYPKEIDWSYTEFIDDKDVLDLI